MKDLFEDNIWSGWSIKFPDLPEEKAQQYLYGNWEVVYTPQPSYSKEAHDQMNELSEQLKRKKNG